MLFILGLSPQRPRGRVVCVFVDARVIQGLIKSGGD